TIVYILLLKILPTRQKLNTYCQTCLDICTITLLVYFTGGIDSINSVFYILIIIYCTLFLGKTGGLTSATISSIAYGLLLCLEHYSIIPHTRATNSEYDFTTGYMFSKIFIHSTLFYIAAFLIKFAVEKEKAAQQLLVQVETEFLELDLLHKAIIESVNSGIVTIDLNKNIRSFNKAAEDITGFKSGNVMGMPIDHIFPELTAPLNQDHKFQAEPQQLTRFTQMTEEGYEQRFTSGDIQSSPVRRDEMTAQGVYGNKIVLGFSISPLLDGNQQKIGQIIIFQDLTANKQMEQNMEKNKRLALIGEMAAGLAHEVRNPLVSLSGSIQLLRKNLELDATNERLMKVVLRGRDQLERLVTNFLLLSKPTKTDCKKIDIKKVILDTLETVRQSPDWNDNIRITTTFCINMELYVNETEMQQVLWNIILNSVQAMPDGGDLNINTLNTQKGDTTWLSITISDTGKGIEECDYINIFQPFFTTREAGTGLGLAIAQKIISAHSGTIHIESIPHKGTKCLLSFPLAFI
ncbi:MAG: ATP-binding protein, partial [Pseudomonadota bacterium]